MTETSYSERKTFERERFKAMGSETLAAHQLDRLNSLLATILPQNRFYAEKLAGFTFPLVSFDGIAELPFTFKNELERAMAGDYAANLTYPIDRYVRFHRTSGTRGRPLVVVDTTEDWQWWVDTWQFILDAADLSSKDRAMLAFSFGPFIGFWSAYEAAVQRGLLVIPGGGAGTLARLEMIVTYGATALFCTPSYALHMAEVAAENQVNIADSTIRVIIVAGEPGGSIPAVRQRIEQAWQARVVDHAGATEVGPWGYSDSQQRGLHVIESEFLAEFISVDTGRPGGEGELCELVLTTLNRSGSPLIRYRTGDLVRPTWNSPSDDHFVLLQGGVLGRVDDMMVIRGVNVFPSAVEQILRSFPEVVEYRMTARRVSEMDSLEIEIEDRLNDPARVAKELQLRLGLRVDVQCVALGSLPRFEAKGKRFVDAR